MNRHIIQMAPNVAEIDGQVDLCCRACRVNDPEDVEYGATMSGFAEFRCHQGANFGAQATLPAIICKPESWIGYIARVSSENFPMTYSAALLSLVFFGQVMSGGEMYGLVACVGR